jgi:peptidyl-prolyl cis-trans isomerase SurA
MQTVTTMARTIRLTAALALLFACATAAAEQVLDRIVAVVNDSVVLQSELEQEMAAVRAQIDQLDMTAPPPRELRRQVLERLVMQRLQLDAAARAGIGVDEATLDAAVRQVAQNNNLTLTGFRDALLAEGMSMSGFRERLRREITINRLHQEAMRRRVNITPQEIDQFLEQHGDADLQYRVSHILVSVPEAADPSEIRQARERAESIRQQLAEGADFASVAAARSDSRTALEGGDLGWRDRGEVPSMLAERIESLEPGDITEVLRSPSGFHIFQLTDERAADRQLVTETRARHILIETNAVVSDRDARTRLANLRQRILNGESFEDLARGNSDDPGSASRGGDLGWVMPGRMVPTFERQMNNLEPGEISQPFETRFGWHIVQVLERRQQDATEEIRRAQAARQIQQRKEEEELQLWLRELRDEAYVDFRLEPS